MVGRFARRRILSWVPFVLAVPVALQFPSGAVAVAAERGLSPGERAFARGDYALAARLLLPEAESGSAVAQTYVGRMYERGLGVPQNYFIAAAWLNQAAQQGEPTAQFMLGLLYDKGFGVPQDWVQAEVWLNLAAAHARHEPEREYWSRLRDAIAQKLTLDQLAEAQQRAAAWAPVAAHSVVIARY